MTLFAKIAAPFAFAVTASVAGAATVSEFIDLTGSGGLGTSYTYVAPSGDLSVTATGHYLNGDGSIGAAALIGQYSNGLGVTTGGTSSSSSGHHSGGSHHHSHYSGCGHYSSSTDDSHQVDSFGDDEVVQFAFDSAVSISTIYFNYVGIYDDFSFSVISTGGSVMSFNGNLDILGAGYGSYTFTGPLPVASIFGIGAAGYGDAFKIAALDVLWEDEVTPAVPLPASALLMLGAFGTFGAMRRRRKAA